MCSNEADYKEETQAVQTQKRSQGRDAESGMIINNALRKRNQKECLTAVKRATEAGGLRAVASWERVPARAAYSGAI